MKAVVISATMDRSGMEEAMPYIAPTPPTGNFGSNMISAVQDLGQYRAERKGRDEDGRKTGEGGDREIWIDGREKFGEEEDSNTRIIQKKSKRCTRARLCNLNSIKSRHCRRIAKSLILDIHQEFFHYSLLSVH